MSHSIHSLIGDLESNQGFEVFSDYLTFAQRFLDSIGFDGQVATRSVQANIVAQKNDHYRFFQYNQGLILRSPVR